MVSSKQIIEFISFSTLFLGSLYFGFNGQPTEMGLAIVCGFTGFALVNLDKFSKIKAAGFEAELREKIEAVIEKETEYELDISGEVKQTPPDTKSIDNQTRKVIDALQHHRYTWRYLGGIRKDTMLNTSEIKSSLNWLIQNGYVKQTLGKHGTMWNLTEEGRYLSAVIDFEDVSE